MKPYKHRLPYGSGVPRHFNCRSTEIPFLKTFKELGEPTLREIPPGTQWTPDGEIAADITLQDWLRGKPKKFVEEMLGKKRSQMFLDGTISLNDLISHNQRTLTLSELRDRAEGLRVKGVPHRTKKYKKVHWGTSLVIQEALETIGIVTGIRQLKATIEGLRSSPTNLFSLLDPSVKRELFDEPGGDTTFDALRQFSIGLWHEGSLIPDFPDRDSFVNWASTAGSGGRPLRGAEFLWDEFGDEFAGRAALEYDRQIRAFEELQLDRFGPDDLSPAWAAADWNERYQGIVFDRGFFQEAMGLSDPDRYIANLTAGWHAEGLGHLEGLISHEFGHILKSNIDQLGDSRALTLQSVLEETLPLVRADSASFGLGEYAGKSVEELFAETYASIQWVPPSEWTEWHQKFYDILISIVGDRPILNAPTYYGRGP